MRTATVLLVANLDEIMRSAELLVKVVGGMPGLVGESLGNSDLTAQIVRYLNRHDSSEICHGLEQVEIRSKIRVTLEFGIQARSCTATCVAVGRRRVVLADLRLKTIYIFGTVDRYDT